MTVGFLSFALARLWRVFNLRMAGTGLIRNEVVRNRWVRYAIAVCLVLTAAATRLPGLSTVLEVVPPDRTGWTVVLAGSIAPLLVGQAALAVVSRFGAGRR